MTYASIIKILESIGGNPPVSDLYSHEDATMLHRRQVFPEDMQLVLNKKEYFTDCAKTLLFCLGLSITRGNGGRDFIKYKKDFSEIIKDMRNYGMYKEASDFKKRYKLMILSSQ